VAPNEKTIQSAYDMFLEKGIVGAVAVLAIAALIWAVVKLLVSKDERIKDQGLFTAALLKTNEGVSSLTIEVNKSATAALTEVSRKSMALGTSIEQLEKSIQVMDAKVSSLRDEHVRLVATIDNGYASRGRR
jgi:hypothetical protein